MCDIQKDVKQPLKLYENLARSICNSTILAFKSVVLMDTVEMIGELFQVEVPGASQCLLRLVD